MIRKINILLISIFIVSSVLGQYDEDIDLSFKKIKSNTENKVRIQFSAQLNLSTIWGSDAMERRNAIDSVRQFFGIDVYRIGMLPGAQIEFIPEVKINQKFAFEFGLKYSHLGWKEFARDRVNSANNYRFSVKNNFHYIGIPLGFSYNISESFSIKFHHDALFLAFERVKSREVIVQNNQRDVVKENYDFEEAYGVRLNRYLSTFNLSFKIKLLDFLYFNTGLGVSTNIIRDELDVKLMNIQTGLIFKL